MFESSPTHVLSKAGIAVPLDAEILHREQRSVVVLDSARLAYVATSLGGMQRLATERAVLELVAPKVSFQVPAVLGVDDRGRFDIRTRIPSVDPWTVFRRVVQDDEFATQLGRTLGGMIAQLHQTAPTHELSSQLPKQMRWPLPSRQILEQLPYVIEDPSLRGRIQDALQVFDALEVKEQSVLIHGDVGFHNMGFDETRGIIGLFDFDDAALTDRHWDFRNFVFHPMQPQMLTAVCESYEDVADCNLDRSRIVLYNAISAFSHLAFRAGHRPEERWCGRTLEEDLAWCKDRLVDLEQAG